MPQRPVLVSHPHNRHVISEDLFAHVLTSERKRADRSNQPCVVLILATSGRSSASGSFMWREIIDALTVSTREADVVGWIERGTAIGVILHEPHAQDPAYPREFEARVRRELARHVDAPSVASLSIGLRFFSTDRTAEPAQPDDLDSHHVPRPFHDREDAYDAIKRVLDVVLSFALLVILAPVLLLVATLIKLKCGGPILFHQERIGRMKKPFKMLKFRTMTVNADHALHREFVSQFINAAGNAQPVAANAVYKITCDPRVTPIGHVLRKTSLDELPQLWNVLRGDMSLVGPRPPLPYEVAQYKSWHTRRLIEAKPGITGLWQVGGRSRTTFDDMVRLDLRYAKTRSFWMDIKILAATPAAVFSGKGAC